MRVIVKVMLIAFILILQSAITLAQWIIPLYPGPIPHSIATPDEEAGSGDAITKVSRPTLTIFLPKKSTASKAAVIICPGGGYGSLVMNREGYQIAKEFTDMGIAAFVLKYRLPDDKIMLNRATGALQDAQQALKIVRQSAPQYNLDSNKIGMIGFSAGGHLVSTAGTHFNNPLIEADKGINVRPDFIILVYPVISFTDSLVHKGSMHNLLGPSPSAELINNFSNELMVSADTPPAFLVHAADDLWVPAGNSISFYEALQKNGIPGELHIYSKGDHGFLNFPPLRDWMGLCKNWLLVNKLIID